MALSRYREFAADRGSAIITGNPSHLASALMAISGVMERVPSRDLREMEKMNAFFINFKNLTELEELLKKQKNKRNYERILAISNPK